MAYMAACICSSSFMATTLNRNIYHIAITKICRHNSPVRGQLISMQVEEAMQTAHMYSMKGNYNASSNASKTAIVKSSIIRRSYYSGASLLRRKPQHQQHHMQACDFWRPHPHLHISNCAMKEEKPLYSCEGRQQRSQLA